MGAKCKIDCLLKKWYKHAAFGDKTATFAKFMVWQPYKPGLMFQHILLEFVQNLANQAYIEYFDWLLIHSAHGSFVLAHNLKNTINKSLHTLKKISYNFLTGGKHLYK